jgi:hypothetical protein
MGRLLGKVRGAKHKYNEETKTVKNFKQFVNENVILEELSDAELLQIVDECQKEGWEDDFYCKNSC